MTPVAFLPGFDGDITLRRGFLEAMGERRAVVGVSYPNRTLGSLDGYREHAMALVPVDWKPVLVAESFSGLVAARWASMDSRIAAVVLCGAFARNPVGAAAELGARWPSVVRMGPLFTAPIAHASGDRKRREWSAGFSRALGALRDDVIAERMRLIATEDVGAELGRLSVPLLVVQFEGDFVVGRLARDQLEAVCHNAHVLRLPGPHFALETRPRECAAAIEERLRALLPGPPPGRR